MIIIKGCIHDLHSICTPSIKRLIWHLVILLFLSGKWGILEVPRCQWECIWKGGACFREFYAPCPYQLSSKVQKHWNKQDLLIRYFPSTWWFMFPNFWVCTVWNCVRLGGFKIIFKVRILPLWYSKHFGSYWKNDSQLQEGSQTVAAQFSEHKLFMKAPSSGQRWMRVRPQFGEGELDNGVKYLLYTLWSVLIFII